MERITLVKCDDGAIIAIESTISPGTIDKYVRPVIEKSNKNIKCKVYNLYNI